MQFQFMYPVRGRECFKRMVGAITRSIARILMRQKELAYNVSRVAPSGKTFVWKLFNIAQSGMIKAIAQTAKKDTGINRTNLLMILVQNNKVIILTIQKQEITELLVHRMVIHQLMKIANVTVKREYVLTVFQDFISMPMQHVRNFLKTVQLQTLMDNAQAAFKVLEYRMANVSNKFVTNPFVLPSTLINQNASHVLNAHT